MILAADADPGFAPQAPKKVDANQSSNLYIPGARGLFKSRTGKTVSTKVTLLVTLDGQQARNPQGDFTTSNAFTLDVALILAAGADPGFVQKALIKVHARES